MAKNKSEIQKGINDEIEKEKLGLKEISPGVMVSTNFKVKIPHPDPCYYISKRLKKEALGTDGKVFIFSSEEKAQECIGAYREEYTKNYRVATTHWSSFVENFSEFISFAILDYNPKKEGFFQEIPVRSDI